MSIATFALSYIAAKESIEQLILERANTRLSMIVQGFSNIANDIDIYSYKTSIFNRLRIQFYALKVGLKHLSYSTSVSWNQSSIQENHQSSDQH